MNILQLVLICFLLGVLYPAAAASASTSAADKTWAFVNSHHPNYNHHTPNHNPQSQNLRQVLAPTIPFSPNILKPLTSIVQTQFKSGNWCALCRWRLGLQQQEQHQEQQEKLHPPEETHRIDGRHQFEKEEKGNNDLKRYYFVTCIPGLQNVLASEIRSILHHDENHKDDNDENNNKTNNSQDNDENDEYCITPVGSSGVSFVGTSRSGLKCLLWCRTAHRIMERIASSSSPCNSGYDYGDDHPRSIRDRHDLYSFVQSSLATPKGLPKLLGNGRGGLHTLSVHAIYTSSPSAASRRIPKDLSHGHYTALTVKNALVDAVRDMRKDGRRPDVDREDADVPLVVVVRGKSMTSWSGSNGRNGYNNGRNSYRMSDSNDDRWDRRNNGRNNGNYDYDEVEDDLAADVDVYRCLHSCGSLHRRGYRQLMDNEDDTTYKNDDYDYFQGSNDNDYDDDDWNQSQPSYSSSQSSRTIQKHAKSSFSSSSTSSNAIIHKAAMKETLAAGLLFEAGWDKLVRAAKNDGRGAILVDPMTGSATLPVEAALMAADVAPALVRIASWRSAFASGYRNVIHNEDHFDQFNNNNDSDDNNRNPHRYPPAVRWRDFTSLQEWDLLLLEATRRAKLGMKWACSTRTSTSSSQQLQSSLASESAVSPKMLSITNQNVAIYCNEKNERASLLARSSIQHAGVSPIVAFHEGDCAHWDLGGNDIAPHERNNHGHNNNNNHYHENNDCNHPQNRAIIEGRTIIASNPPWGKRLSQTMDDSWVSLRHFLRREAYGTEAWILCGNKELTKILRMKKSRMVRIQSLNCFLTKA